MIFPVPTKGFPGKAFLIMDAMSNTTKRTRTLLFIIGIVLIASNLRAPITSVGPVIPQIQEALGLSNTVAGLITTIPLLMFAVFSPIAPKLAEKRGIEMMLWLSLWVIGIGVLVRVVPSATLLLVGSALIGCGIAFGNVLIPPLIRHRFPERMGVVTGVYSVAMNITASLASGLSIAIGRWTGAGWKGSIGVWGVFAIIAILVWIPQLWDSRKRVKKENRESEASRSGSLLRSRLAWHVTIFMGLQSLLFYCSVAWLPVVLQSWGMPSDESGWVLSFVQFTQLPIVFIGPIVIAKLKNHMPLLWFILITLVVSILLIIFWRTQFIVPAVILFGLGTGLAFSLVMMWFVLRTATTSVSARLSGMAQSFGYALAAAGPPLFGTLHDWTGNWEGPFVLLFIASLGLFFFGYRLAKPVNIE